MLFSFYIFRLVLNVVLQARVLNIATRHQHVYYYLLLLTRQRYDLRLYLVHEACVGVTKNDKEDFERTEKF